MINKWYQLKPATWSYRPLITGVVISFILAVVFSAVLEDIVRREPIIRVDQSVEGWILAHASPVTTGISTDVSIFGNATVISIVSVLIVGWWAFQRNWLLSTGLLASVFGGGALDFVLKLLVRRPRPDFPNAPLHEMDFGFPSGHAMLSVIFFGFLAFVIIQSMPGSKWRWLVGLIAGLVPLVVGFSRLLLGAHYPTDVLAGWLAGAVWLVVCISILVTLKINTARTDRT